MPMDGYKSVTIDAEHHEKLREMFYDLRAKSMTELVHELIDKKYAATKKAQGASS